jgi:AcrR family transcriptional regulator
VTAPSRATRVSPARATNRKRLSRDQVVVAAVALADEQGIESLTMRNLSQTLGVVPMALYKHVANKDELLDLMVDVVFDELDYEQDGEWRAVLHDRALALREALIQHSWAIGLMESGTLGPARMSDHELVMRCLREDAGLSFAMALHALSVLDGLVYGFALQQRAYAADLGVKRPSEAQKVVSVPHVVPPDRYPYFSELLDKLAKQGYDYREEFEFGLELLLDGIGRLR